MKAVRNTDMSNELRMSSWALGAAAFATLLGSSCCVMPLVLVSLGLSGAWLSNLRILEPYSPLLIGAAVVALGFAAKALFRGRTTCSVSDGTYRGRARCSAHRAAFWVITALTLLLIIVPLAAPWFY